MYIKKGLITCIMGKNGMGKTTLLETIIGHHNPYLGNINYNGKNIEKLLPWLEWAYMKAKEINA